MTNIDNKNNIIGISLLEDDDNDLNLMELEKEIIQDIKPEDINYKNKDDDELKSIMRGIDSLDDDMIKDDRSTMSTIVTKYNKIDQNPEDDYTNGTEEFEETEEEQVNLTDNFVNEYSLKEPSQSEQHHARFEIKDPRVKNMTMEQLKQDRINSAYSSLKNTEQYEDEEYEDEEDDEYKEADKIIIFNEYCDLRECLEEAKVNLSRVPKVTLDNDVTDISRALELLKLVETQSRYVGYAEETILTMASGVEVFLNGEREMFGSKPNAKGYSENLKIKLKRLRYHSSKAVEKVVKSSGSLSTAMIILLEIVPSLFTQIRNNSKKKEMKDRESTETFASIRQKLE